MPHTAIVVFTGRPIEEILDPKIQGSGNWRLDLARAEAAEFVVCTRNRHSRAFRATPEAHRAAFLIGRDLTIVDAPDQPGRCLIKMKEYAIISVQNIWGKSGKIHLRYPVWYTTLEELGVDLATLPPFQPVPAPEQPPQLSEAASALPMPPQRWMLPPPDLQRPPGPATEARFDAILAQLDRIPDLATPLEPLHWDGHGLPR